MDKKKRSDYMKKYYLENKQKYSQYYRKVVRPRNKYFREYIKTKNPNGFIRVYKKIVIYF